MDFPEELFIKYSNALDGFLGRTWSSNSVSNSEKRRRLDIAMNAMSLIRLSGVSFSPWNILFKNWDEMPQTLEMGQALESWCTSRNQFVAQYAQVTTARILGSVWERDDSWITLAARVYGLQERDLRVNIALGDDSVLLIILIHLTRQSLRSNYSNYVVLEALSKLHMRNTLPRLQHDFCALWNEIVEEARDQGPYATPVDVLIGIRHLYIALHQGIHPAPTAFSASTDHFNPILRWPSSYPFCNVAGHRPLSAQHDYSFHVLSHPPTDGDNTASRQARAQQVNNITTTTSKIGATSHGPDTNPLTNPVHSSSRPTVHHRQLLWPLRHKISPRPLHCLILWREVSSRTWI
jgi:hypothetical protein